MKTVLSVSKNQIFLSRLTKLVKTFLIGGSKQRLGLLGECKVKKELTQKGYRIIERNWRCSVGELDLIAARGNTLVIVEVKTRKKEEHNFEAIDAIDWKKERKLQLLAEQYTTTHRAMLRRLGISRFQIDLFTVLYQKRPNSIKYSFELEHFPDALEWKKDSV